jgi:hypothetical protein
MMPGQQRTTTKPDTTPAGEPAPEPAETVEPTAPPTPAPGPVAEPHDGLLASWERLSVGEAIAEVTKRIGAIEKAHTTEQGERYKYRGIDDVLAALHPLLGEVGLVLMPGRITAHRRETRTTSRGSTLNVAIVDVEYRLIGPDGSETTGASTGEAHDSGDKATQKALSQAYKTFALQTFSIPTEASADDEPDATNEPARPFTAEEQQRAAVAWRAAHDAPNLEALVGVRRRAAALLDVPLVLPGDGSLVPLSVLFDRRRAELEGATG